MTKRQIAFKEIPRYGEFSAKLTEQGRFGLCFEIDVENKEEKGKDGKRESFKIRAIGGNAGATSLDVFLFHRSDPSASYARVFDDHKFVVTENPEKTKRFFTSTYTTPASALFSSLRAITTSASRSNGTGVSDKSEDAHGLENKRIIGLLRGMEDLMRKAGPVYSYMDNFN
jgi:hypothetical protein